MELAIPKAPMKDEGRIYGFKNKHKAVWRERIGGSIYTVLSIYLYISTKNNTRQSFEKTCSSIVVSSRIQLLTKTHMSE